MKVWSFGRSRGIGYFGCRKCCIRDGSTPYRKEHPVRILNSRAYGGRTLIVSDRRRPTARARSIACKAEHHSGQHRFHRMLWPHGSCDSIEVFYRYRLPVDKCWRLRKSASRSHRQPFRWPILADAQPFADVRVTGSANRCLSGKISAVAQRLPPVAGFRPRWRFAGWCRGRVSAHRTMVVAAADLHHAVNLSTGSSFAIPIRLIE